MLKQKFVIQFGSQFGIKILGMIAGLFVARIAGPEVVGIIAYGTAYLGIWGFLTGLFGTGHIKLISEGKPLGDCIATYARLQLGSVMVFLAIVLGLFFYQSQILDNYFESRTQEIVIILILVSTILHEVINFSQDTFTATLMQFKANLPMIVKSVIYQAGRILIVFLGFRAIGLAGMGLISTVIAVPLAWNLIRKLDFGKFKKKLFQKHLAFAKPVFLMVVIDSIMNYSDKLLLAYYTNATELGYYSAAFSIGGVFLLISKSVGTIFFPLFSNLIARKDWFSVNQKIDDFQYFIALFIFPFICLLVIIGGPFLITLIGDKYEPSVAPFKVLLFATYLSIVGMPYGNMISGMGRFYIDVLINFICLVVFIISIFLLLDPRFLGLGVLGIAINLLILNFTRSLLYMVYAFRIGELRLKLVTGLPYLLIFAVTLLFLYFESTFSGWTNFWWLIISPVYVVTIYLILYVFGFLRRKEITHLIDILNLKKLYDYIQEEWKS